MINAVSEHGLPVTFFLVGVYRGVLIKNENLRLTGRVGGWVSFMFFLRGRGVRSGNSGSVKNIKPGELHSFQNSCAWSGVPEHPDLLLFLSIASVGCIRGRKTANKVEFELLLRKTNLFCV